MKTNTPAKNRSGFTLIEMIGVLAIIAVLAALLIPRIFSAINESRVNGAALSYNSVKSAAMSYFGKYGRFGDAAGQPLSQVAIDATTTTPIDFGATLLTLGFTEKPFATKLGDSGKVNLVKALTATTAVADGNAAYDLDGTGGTANDTSGQLVIQAVLVGVPESDALELNNKIDGDMGGAVPYVAATPGDPSATPPVPPTPASGGNDLTGRVKYAYPVNGVTDVYIYVAHK